MDWLFDNPLADMHGTQFLFLYAVFAGIVIIAAVFFVDMQDMTGAMAPPPTPRDPDAYELAYLRGGANEVIRTAIYALRQKRLIEIVEKERRIKATGVAPGAFEITRLEQRVYEAILPAPLISELFKGPNLRDDVESLCGAYRQSLAPQQLLTPPEVKRAAQYALPIGIGLLVAAAGYKIIAAILHGRSNLVFLFIETAAACFLLYWLVRNTTSGNASKRGKAWLSQIQLAYAGHVASAFGGGAVIGAAARRSAPRRCSWSACSVLASSKARPTPRSPSNSPPRNRAATAAAAAAAAMGAGAAVAAAAAAAGIRMPALAEIAPLGVGLGYRPPFRADLFRNRERVDFLEIVADHYFDAQREKRDELDLLANNFTLIPHGLDLSIGSAEGIDSAYLDRFAALIARLDPPYWSEHLAFTRAGGIAFGHLACLPYTNEAVDIVARNVETVRRRIGVPLILENITATALIPGAQMDEPEFVGAVLEATGCGWLCDVTNLFANAFNAGREAAAELDRWPWERVVQMHFAGGRMQRGRVDRQP